MWDVGCGIQKMPHRVTLLFFGLLASYIWIVFSFIPIINCLVVQSRTRDVKRLSIKKHKLQCSFLHSCDKTLSFMTRRIPESRTLTVLFSSNRVFESSIDSEELQTLTKRNEDNDYPNTTRTFITNPMKVYIEDTDAYGVLYNSNYLRCYDRALYISSITGCNSNRMKSRDWSIASVKEMKFKGSPPLGGSYIIKGKMIDNSSDGHSELWDMEMIEATDKNEDENNLSKTVYNIAIGIRILHPENHDRNALYNINPSIPFNVGNVFSQKTSSNKSSVVSVRKVTANNKKMIDKFMVFRDEFDQHLVSHLPLRNVLNLFERSRSNALGGPDELRRLQHDENIIFVVTSIKDLQLFSYSVNADYNRTDSGKTDSLDQVEVHPSQVENTEELQQYSSLTNSIQAGQELIVETEYVVKKRGMIIECHHKMRIPNINPTEVIKDGNTVEKNKSLVTMTDNDSVESGNNYDDCRMYAQGIVTLMALDERSRRPTSKLPDWLLVKLTT